MIKDSCYICNTVTGNEYKVSNAEVYLICSDKCLDILLRMKSILYFIHDMSRKYGKIMSIKEITSLLEGWLKPVKTKGYIEELVNRGFLIKQRGEFVEVV